MNCAYIIFVICALGLGSASFINPYSKTKGYCADRANVRKPLFLTQYIESGRLAEGRKAAVVPPLLDNIASYSGFFTINKKHDSNIFFWFFPAEQSPETAPVVIWLQGGPGASSVYAIFKENGPFHLMSNNRIGRKLHYWSQKMNIIYIDQPVGTGYSFSRSESGFANNMAEVGQDLYEALLQFFKLFPEYRKNEFIVTGESYAGKFIPAVAYTIHKSNPTSAQKINLKGIAIGNGWVDPYNMIDYANLLFNLDFIDMKTRSRFLKIENHIKSLIEQKKHVEAFWALDKYFDADLTGYPPLVQNVTGISFYYNFIEAQKNDNDDDMVSFLNQPVVRRSIHVGNLTFNDQNDDVEQHLIVDEMLSIVPWLEVLMNHYKVLLYNGQLDLICAYSLTMNYVRKLKWKGADKYARAERKQWYVGEDLAGYYKTAGNFTELLVRNAGHMVPGDQPLWALDMITNFAFNKPFKNAPYKLRTI